MEQNWYENFIEKLQKQIDEAEFGSERYYKLLDVLSRVQEMKLKEDRSINDAVEEYNRNEQNKKSEKKKFWLDIAKIVAPASISLAMLILVMVFEQCGKIIPQRFLAWISRPKL